jgi:hypothetical protein
MIESPPVHYVASPELKARVLAISVIVGIVLAIGPPRSAASSPQAKPCFSIGDTVTVTGRYWPIIGSNFQLYQPRNKNFCVRYPKRTDHIPLPDLDVNVRGGAIRDITLPQNAYLEATGVLTDLFPETVIGFKVISFRNVDAEVKAEIAAWTQHCKEWQEGQAAILSKRLHGGNIGRDTDALGRKCGISGVDAQLPHGEIGPIWRKEPR